MTGERAQDPPRLVLVRHGEAAAGWGEDVDPGLSARGRAQAEALAEALAPLGPRPIVVSPARRTRETAAPLERRWGVAARLDPAVGEVPSPDGDVAARMRWLRELLRVRVDEWGDDLQRWRSRLVAALAALPDGAVVVTHFVAIRVASGVEGFRPDHCSRTVLRRGAAGLEVVELGAQGATVVR